MAYMDTWRFDDCTIIEDVDFYTVEVVRHGVHGYQIITPADMDVFHDDLDTALIDEALADGPSPLYIWEDGAGVTLGYGMLASRQELASIIRDAECLGGEAGPEDVGDQFLYKFDDGKILVVYTGECLGDDWNDENVINDAVCFGAVRRGEPVPDRYDRTTLFSVED